MALRMQPNAPAHAPIPPPLRGTRLRVGPLCRCATSPHTVGSHPLHKGGFAGRCKHRPLHAIVRGRHPSSGAFRRPGQPCDYRKTVGADFISARTTMRNYPTARRGQAPLRTDINIIQPPKPPPLNMRPPLLHTMLQRGIFYGLIPKWY